MSWLLTTIAGGIIGKNLIKEAMTPTLTADDWFNKELVDKDRFESNVPMTTICKWAAQGRYKFNPALAETIKETFTYKCNGYSDIGEMSYRMSKLLNNGYAVELKVIPDDYWGIRKTDLQRLGILRMFINKNINRENKVRLEIVKCEDSIKFVPHKL